jgi:hypothetical protein
VNSNGARKSAQVFTVLCRRSEGNKRLRSSPLGRLGSAIRTSAESGLPSPSPPFALTYASLPPNMLRSVGYLRIDRVWCHDWFWRRRRCGHRAFFGPRNDARATVRRRFRRRRGHAETADDGENLTDHPGMQPGRLTLLSEPRKPGPGRM